MSPDPKLISVREAAKRLGIGRDSVYKLIHDKRLRTVRVGRLWLVPVTELDAFVERETEGAA